MPLPQPKIGQNLAGTLVKSYPTPASDVALEAAIEGNVEDYLQTLYGTPPPENTNPDFLLVNEAPINWTLVKRKYVQDRTNEGTYNASISYEKQTKTAPVFTRDYIVRRANYVERTRGTALSGLVNATVTAAGTGYDQATVAVVLSGGTGSGGAITAIVSNGAIVQLVITAEGNYTVAPTLTINGGTGATGTAAVQPQSAVLVKEDYIRTPDSDLDGLYVLVRRVYMTLPGPTVNSTRIDFDGAVVNVATTAKLISAIVSGELVIGGNVWQKTTLKEADSTLWAYEVVETRDVPGFLIPLPTEEREAGDVVTTSHQLVLIGNIVSNEAIVAANWVKYYGKPFEGSHEVALQITESRPHTGNVLPFDKLDPLDQVPVFGTKQLDLVSNITPLVKEDVSGSNWTRTYLDPMPDSHLVAFIVTETRLIVGPVVAEEGRPDFDGLTIDTTRQLVAVGSIVEGESIATTLWLRKFGRQHEGSSKVALQFIETRLATGNAIPLPTEIREAGDAVTITNQLVPLPITTEEAIDGGGNWVLSYGKPHDSARVGILVTESRPATGGISTDYEAREADDIVTIQKQLVENADLPTPFPESIDGSGNWIRQFAKAHPQSGLVSWLFTESRAVPGNSFSTEQLVEASDVQDVVKTLVPLSGHSASDDVSGGVTWTREWTEPYPESVLVGWFLRHVQTIPGNPLVTKERDPDGAEVIVTRKLKPTPITTSDAIVSTTWTRITAEPLESSTKVAWEVVRVRAVPGPTLLSWETDPETFDVIKVEKTLIAASTITTTPSGIANANQETTYVAINDLVALKTVRTINAGSAPSGRTEYKVAEFSFPRRLYAITGSGIVDNAGNVYIKLNTTAQAAQRPKCIFKAVVTYQSSALSVTPSDYTNFILKEIIYSGLFFSVNQGDVINDEITLTYNTGSSNPLWPDLTETVTFTASSPISASGYDSLIGTFMLISANFTPWRFNTNRLEKIYILVPDE